MSSTAFVYTREGFVISADGRCTLPDGAIASDTETKIFPIRSESLVAAYALTGHIGLGFHDLTVEAAKVAAEFSRRSFVSGYECAHALARGLKRYIGEGIRDGLIKEAWIDSRRSADGFARLIMAGFFAQQPFFCTVNFVRREQGKIILESVTHPLFLGTAVAEGSNTIQLLIKGRDSRFRNRPELFGGNPPTDTLAEGTRFTRGLIKAMCDEQARTIDPERCNRIGGHIHTAAVIPEDETGFHWVMAPLSPG